MKTRDFVGILVLSAILSFAGACAPTANLPTSPSVQNTATQELMQTPPATSLPPTVTPAPPERTSPSPVATLAAASTQAPLSATNPSSPTSDGKGAIRQPSDGTYASFEFLLKLENGRFIIKSAASKFVYAQGPYQVKGERITFTAEGTEGTSDCIRANRTYTVTWAQDPSSNALQFSDSDDPCDDRKTVWTTGAWSKQQ